jgi:hypothetical protein
MTRKKNKTYRVIKTKKKRKEKGKGQIKTRKICLLARIIAPNVGPMGLLIQFIPAHKSSPAAHYKIQILGSNTLSSLLEQYNNIRCRSSPLDPKFHKIGALSLSLSLKNTN